MENKNLLKIRGLLKVLPGRDPYIGAELLAKRKFEDLAMLVDSDIYKVNLAQSKPDCPDKYKNIDAMDLIELKMAIDKYI